MSLKTGENEMRGAEVPPYPKESRGKHESLSHFLERLEQRRWSWEKSQPTELYGAFLEELSCRYPFDWFGTFTFSEPVSPATAHYWFRRYLAWAKGLTEPYAFRADEYGPGGGRLHLHALVGNVAHLAPYCGESLPPRQWGCSCCWLHRWPCGYARILPYDPTKGARYYVAKYVSKTLGDYEFIGFDQGLIFKSKLEMKEIDNGFHRS